MQNNLVVITGASSGIGKAAAQAFSKLGHPLLLLARRFNEQNSLDLPNCLCEKVDVRDQEALKEAIDKATKKFGPVDCLVNNAGIMLLGDMATQNPEEWKKMYDVNVIGVLNGIHLVLKEMIERKSGTIINISSVAGRKTFPAHAAYCGTKFALHAMTENIREEVAEQNVRLITIAPGAVETELLSHTTSNEIKNNYENWKKDIGGAIAAKDIAQAILFAYQQPQNICVREIVMAATRQAP